MTGKITTKKNKTTITFKWEQLSPAPEKTIEAAAHHQWARGAGDHSDGVKFEDLSQQDHLDIWDEYLKSVTLAAARQNFIDVAKSEATKEAMSQSDKIHGLGD